MTKDNNDDAKTAEKVEELVDALAEALAEALTQERVERGADEVRRQLGSEASRMSVPASERQLMDTIGRTVEAVGRVVMGVSPTVDDVELPFMYTIGNALQDQPELLIIGALGDQSMNLLNLLSEMMRLGRLDEHRESLDRPGGWGLIDLGGDSPLALVKASGRAQEEYTRRATWWLKTKGVDTYSVLQVVVPDEKGRFPWDDDVEDPYGLIPVLVSDA